MLGELTDIAIKYKKIKIDEDLYVFFPVDVLEGFGGQDNFYSQNDIYRIVDNFENNIPSKFIVGHVESLESLKKKYKMDDKNAIKKKYLKEEKERAKFIILSNKQEQRMDHQASEAHLQHEKVQDLNGISLQGMITYIKKYVFGHDEEVKLIATKVLMNYTSTADEKNESILLMGPTGTGKTETIKAIINYLNIPSVEINSSNLVPEGIKGMSLEDSLNSLFLNSNKDLNKAQKGLIFFDEFDKLSLNNLDYKASVLQTMQKFIDGGTFLIQDSKDNFFFNTSKLIQIFAGAFPNIYENSRMQVGFMQEEKPEIGSSAILESKTFSKELISRIPHIVVYKALSKEMQRNILLHSELSQILIKKKRYKRQFGVDIVCDDSYIEAILEKLEAENKSMRDLNNLIIQSFNEAEAELFDNHRKYKKLILTRKTVENNKEFALK